MIFCPDDFQGQLLFDRYLYYQLLLEAAGNLQDHLPPSAMIRLMTATVEDVKFPENYDGMGKPRTILYSEELHLLQKLETVQWKIALQKLRTISEEKMKQHLHENSDDERNRDDSVETPVERFLDNSSQESGLHAQSQTNRHIKLV